MSSFSFRQTIYDGVVFDCDGVLLDSNQMKVEAFSQAALDQGFSLETVAAFSRWQRVNFGISRYKVFDKLMSGAFGSVPWRASSAALIQNYAQNVRIGYLTCRDGKGLETCLAALTQVPLFVCSGSDESELKEVFSARSLLNKFSQVYGSPVSKNDNLAYIVRTSALNRMLFLGDARSDLVAAKNNAVDFVFVSSMSMVKSEMLSRQGQEGFEHVAHLEEFAAEIERVLPK